MARNERYVTTIELNSQQAQDHLKQLENKIASLRKEKEKALKSGGFFNEKELTNAIKQYDKFKFQIEGTGKAMANVAGVSAANLRKVLKELRKDASHMLPETSELKEKEKAIEEVERRIKELKNSARESHIETEKLVDDIENMSKVMSDLKSASIDQLISAKTYLEGEVSKQQYGSWQYNIQDERLTAVNERLRQIKEEHRQINTLMDQYNHEISESERKAKSHNAEMEFVNATLEKLPTAKVRDMEYAIKMLNEQMRGMDRGDAYDVMKEKVKRLRTELEKTRFEAKAQQSVLSRTADFFNKVQGTVIVGLSSITGLTLTVRRAIQAFADMDQEMENVRKYTGQTSEQVHEMNEEFKQMDTRTSRERLNQLAGDAGRLGIQGKEAIMEFVDAADKINVALGDDLGENAVKNIGKLTMSFGTDKTKGLRGGMLSTASAVNELSQNSSAAANYLVDFTARVAGFGKQVGLAQTQIMGYAAVMDENMLQDEMAATAFGQLLVKMTTDIETFARITGMKTEEFKKLVTEDINGAILAVAKSLKGRDMQDLGKVFDAMNLDGQRAIGVLSTLGDKVDDVTERQRIASEAFEKGSSVIGEFNIQNNTVQAGLEKAKKQFNDLRIVLGEKLLPVARYGLTTASAVIKILSELANFIGKFKYTIAILSTTIAFLVLKKEADVAVTKLGVFWNTKLANSVEKLLLVMKKNPWTAAATGILLVVGAISDLVRRSMEATEAADKLNKVRTEAAKKVGEEKARLDVLLVTARNENASLKNRLQAIKELNRIIPNYNGGLDATTKKYVENKEALDKYLQSLAKKFELEGAREMLKDIGGDIAKASVEIEKLREKLGDDKNINMLRGINKTIVGENETKQLLSQFDEQNKIIEDAGKQRQAIYRRYPELTGVVVEDMEGRASRHLQEILNRHNKKDNPLKPFSDPKAEEKKRKAAETAAKKLEAQQKKELKERNDAIKAQTEQELAIVMNRYAKGEIDYRKYISEIDRIQLDGFNRRLAIYDEESDEYKKILNDREQYNLRSVERQERMNQREVELVHQSVMAELQTKQWSDEGEYLEAMYQEDVNYLQNKAALYRKGSEERVEIEEEIQEREYLHQLERQKRHAEMVEELRENYLNLGNERQLAIALNGLEELHRQGLIKEEEYQKAKIAIQAQFASAVSPDQQARQTGSQMLANARNKVNQDAQANNSDIGSPIVGTIKQYQATMEQLKILYGNDEKNHAAYLAAKAQATSEFCAQLASEFQAAYSSINQIMSAASSYYSAQSDYEIALMNKRYDKEAEKAGNNQKKLKKIEEKRQKEEAAIKSKYNAKAVKIQVAQAIASTALSAINAYSSAAQVPVVGYILAPIAAAAAVAAGMIQVAAIKKQAQAQEAGYYFGGYTGGRQYSREAGVVHEGEWVANHQAVNNPNVRPMLDFIDRAQKNNTVGALTADDISRQLGKGGAAVVAPVVNVSNDNEELRQSLDETREVNSRLLEIIEEKGINIDFPMDSFDRSYKHFLKLSKR